MNAARKYDILKTHNDYEPPISRNIEEEIRNNPFNLETNVKGLTAVNHQRNLSNYAEELVANYATYSCDQYELSLEMLPDEEQNEFARLYIESIDREIEWACYGEDESINSDYLCALLAMLKNDCDQTRKNFAKVTRKNILVYYNNSIQEIIDEACNNYLSNRMNEQGFYTNREIGGCDIVWSKF